MLENNGVPRIVVAMFYSMAWKRFIDCKITVFLHTCVYIKADLVERQVMACFDLCGFAWGLHKLAPLDTAFLLTHLFNIIDVKAVNFNLAPYYYQSLNIMHLQLNPLKFGLTGV